MSKEIVKACVKYQDRLYTGFEHGECFNKLNEDNTIIVFNKIEQGFVDSDGNFVDRKQAMIIAKESGQLSYETDKQTLISEDLHLDWLKKQDQKIKALEHRLSNCIEPKFKLEQDVFVIDWSGQIRSGYIFEVQTNVTKHFKQPLITYLVWFHGAYQDDDAEDDYFEEKDVFLTEEEAKAKLRSLEDGK